MTKRNQRIGLKEIDGYRVIKVGRRAAFTTNGWYRLRRGVWIKNKVPCWPRDVPKQVPQVERRRDKTIVKKRRLERLFRVMLRQA